MATVSSHVLDSVSGISAIGIKVQLYRIAQNRRIELFSINTNDEGRIVEEVDIDSFEPDTEYELVFHGAQYYAEQSCPQADDSAIRVMVLRYTMPDPDKRYHMPIMLSPHSYSVWWS